MIKSELEIAQSLIEDKNWNKYRYLEQFNESYKDQLKVLFKYLPDHVLERKKVKKYRSKCINCGQSYVVTSEDDDVGNCFECDFKQAKAIKAKQDEYWKSIQGTYGKANFVPNHLPYETIAKICKYFSFNHYEIGKWKMKKDAYKDILETFKVELTERQFESITSLTYLKQHGYSRY